MTPIKISLTGNEGSGLHDVANEFQKIGVKVFNADIQLKWLLNFDESVVDSVKRHFGSSSIIAGFINPLSFNSDDKFNRLIDLVEFKLFDQFNKFIHKNGDDNICYYIFLSSLIFERKWYNKFDMTIMVNRSKEERVEHFWRSIGNYSISQCSMLFRNELSQEEKSRNSEFIIDNLSKNSMRKQVSDIDSQIIGYYFKKKYNQEHRSLSTTTTNFIPTNSIIKNVIN